MKLPTLVCAIVLCVSAAGQEVNRADLLGVWQSEERGSQHVSIINRHANGEYDIKNYFVDHDLKVFYLRDEWKGTWKLQEGDYIEADPDADFVGTKQKCELKDGKLVFTYLSGKGLHTHTVKVIDTPSKDGKLTYSITYRDVKSEAGWEKAWQQGAKTHQDQESEQGGTGEPATRAESESGEKPKPESEGRSR